MMKKYFFEVPPQKQKRVIVHTDFLNEADDPFAVLHALLTPSLSVERLIAGHFDAYPQDFPKGTTAQASYDELLRFLAVTGHESYQSRTTCGAGYALPSEMEPVPSDGARAIIDEAMRDDPRPLFILLQGAVTDLASAILMEPRICGRMTAVWVGGGDYPEGGDEFNLWNDINGANVLFQSEMPLWQIPKSTYKQLAVTLAELQYKVRPCGAAGRYLFDHIDAYNRKMGCEAIWPHGETWGLGDNAAISVLLEEEEKISYNMIPAPRVEAGSMRYLAGGDVRPVRVYHHVDARQTLEDFFAKLAICCGGLS